MRSAGESIRSSSRAMRSSGATSCARRRSARARGADRPRGPSGASAASASSSSASARRRASASPTRAGSVDLPAAASLPARLPSVRGVRGQVEQVVRDLEREAELQAPRVDGLRGRARRERAARDRRGEERARLRAHELHHLRLGEPRALPGDVARLPLDHEVRVRREEARERRRRAARRPESRCSKASDWSASPTRIAVASSNALWTVGRPRRRSSSSIAGRSSWTSE